MKNMKCLFFCLFISDACANGILTSLFYRSKYNIMSAIISQHWHEIT